MIQKLKDLSTIYIALILSLAAAMGMMAVQPIASADSLTVNFACADGTTATTMTTNSKSHAVVVTCKDGSLIDYINYQNAGIQPVAVAVSCPGTQKVDPEVDTPNQPTSKYTFYCATVTGGTDN